MPNRSDEEWEVMDSVDGKKEVVNLVALPLQENDALKRCAQQQDVAASHLQQDNAAQRAQQQQQLPQLQSTQQQIVQQQQLTQPQQRLHVLSTQQQIMQQQQLAQPQQFPQRASKEVVQQQLAQLQKPPQEQCASKEMAQQALGSTNTNMFAAVSEQVEEGLSPKVTEECRQQLAPTTPALSQVPGALADDAAAQPMSLGPMLEKTLKSLEHKAQQGAPKAIGR